MITTEPPPAKVKTKITIGTRVRHAVYGIGKVLAAWPSWWGCPNCFAETSPPKRVGKKDQPVLCQSCKHTVPVFFVIPEGIFDVAFGPEIHSLYRGNMEAVE